ncbi:MAG: ankyrin repeat domain-containing protein [Alphaproteobacteria bacterium]|nr:ankyrin repeat domain-containing protein [Alphaproteobacteria bacterium]
MQNDLTSTPAPRDLMDAVESNDIGRVKELLVAGADINADVDCGGFGKMTALAKAIMRSGSMEMITLLLDNGANIEAVRSYNGLTPLMQAVLNDRADVVELLLERGADPDKQDFIYRTALDIAYENNKRKMQQILRDARPSRPRQPVVPPAVVARRRAGIDAVRAQLQTAAAKRPKVRLKRGGFPSP